MRLIDADDIAYESIDSSDTIRYEDYYGTGIFAVRKEDIDAMPTIEPERKKGRWEAKSFHEVFCNKCGFDFDIMTNDFFDKMYFCPNCGSYNGGEEE